VWIGVALAGIVAAVVGYRCLHTTPRTSYTAPAARLATAGVTYVAFGRLYVVAQDDGTFLALDEQDRVPASRSSGCVVRWVPARDDGAFREDARCGGATFARDGSPLSGGLGLLRHPVRVAGKSVVVDIRQCMAPEDRVVKLCTAFA
jgi:hypothetical protein